MECTQQSDKNDVLQIDLALHDKISKRLDKLAWSLSDHRKRLAANQAAKEKSMLYLELAPEVSDALRTLSSELFEQDLRILEKKMTIALQEVLKQPVRFRAETGFKGNVATVDFSIERSGNQEDLRRGQGGSVHNILGVGLRMFALTMLNEKSHRRFLMLDEQDCWLQPELVPMLVRIVHEAGKELGFQIIMISHHELKRFEQFADKIYQFESSGDSVNVTDLNPPSHTSDQ